MGKSPSIQSLQAKDDEFRTYLAGLQADLDTKSSAAAAKMTEDIDSFYSTNSYSDAKKFVSGQNTDFMHQSEFTLDNLKTVIDSISKAVFAGASVPTGTDVNADAVAAADQALGAEVGAMANLELYIAGKVFDVLSNVILSFGSSTSISFSSSTKSESLGFGLQMFTSVSASSYQSQSFFNNEYINQYLYQYDVRFSVKQAQEEATMGLVQAYSNQLANFEKRLNALSDQLGNGTITPEVYQSSVGVYETLVSATQAKLASLGGNAPVTA